MQSCGSEFMRDLVAEVFLAFLRFFQILLKLRSDQKLTHRQYRTLDF